MLYEPTQAYAGEMEDEDSNQGEPKKAMMYEPTQAYPGKEDQNKVFTYFDSFTPLNEST